MTAEIHTDRRSLLLAAAPMLADRFDAASVGVMAIAQALGIAEDDFLAEFDGVEQYFAAVQLQFF